MPADDADTLRERAKRWCRLAEQSTDPRVIEALRAETAQLMEQIGRLETKASDSQSSESE